MEKGWRRDAMWKPQCGKRGMTRDKTRNPMKWDKRQSSINKPYEFYLLSEWFSFKSTLCESRMKAAEWNARDLPGACQQEKNRMSPHFHSNEEKATERDHQETLKYQETQGKTQCKQYTGKNTPGVRGTPEGSTSTSSCLVAPRCLITVLYLTRGVLSLPGFISLATPNYK